jgi:septum formation protein
MVHPAQPALILASASPRRRDLLHSLGLEFEVHPADIDESPLPGETAADLAKRLAMGKALSCHQRYPGSLVLAADTVVVVDGPDGEELLGKPVDAAHALAMLRRLSGRRHRVLTGMALAGQGASSQQLATTRVTFLPLTDAVINWYLSTGEAYDKAGAYGVQGCAALFVSSLEGSWTNVVGLPLDLLEALFRDVGQDLMRYLAAGRT